MSRSTNTPGLTAHSSELAHDKYGKEIKPGDVVSFVYGGTVHHMTIDAIAPDDAQRPALTGQITVTVPASSCELRAVNHEPSPAACQRVPGANAPTRGTPRLTAIRPKAKKGPKS